LPACENLFLPPLFGHPIVFFVGFFFSFSLAGEDPFLENLQFFFGPKGFLDVPLSWTDIDPGPSFSPVTGSFFPTNPLLVDPPTLGELLGVGVLFFFFLHWLLIAAFQRFGEGEGLLHRRFFFFSNSRSVLWKVFFFVFSFFFWWRAFSLSPGWRVFGAMGNYFPSPPPL